MSYNQNFWTGNNLCCVSYFSLDAVMDKPDCPAYRHVCVDVESFQVKADAHTYNGWCDY
jgi:hypothetical protein